MLTLDTLQEVFHEEKKPFWRLYEGRTTKGPKRGENSDIEDMEESCDLLIRRLEQYGTGVFTLSLSSAANVQNNRAIQHLIQLSGKAAVAGVVTSPSGGGGGLEQLFTLAERLNNYGNDGISGVLEGEIEKFKLQMQVERLKDENRQLKQGTTKDRFFEAIAGQMPAILSRLTGAAVPALGAVGFETPMERPAATPGDADASSTEDSFSLDQAVLALQEIGELLPGQNLNQLLWKLRDFIHKDPNNARNLLAMM